MKKRVLFICNGNAGRSQMAEGLLRHLHGNLYEVYSAGIIPASEINPLTVAVMQEIGIDISHQRPKEVGEFHDMTIDIVVFLSACDTGCVHLPRAVQIVHAEFPDPSEITGTEAERMGGFRAIRDLIRDWIERTFVKISTIS
jgi:arsenate reductase